MTENKTVAIGSFSFHLQNILSLTLITGVMTFALLFVYYATYVPENPIKDIEVMLGENSVNYTVVQENLTKTDLQSLSAEDQQKVSGYFKSEEIPQFIVTDTASGALVMKIYKTGANGFGGMITALVGTDGEKITALKITSATSETAGLGQKITENAFQRQFIDKTRADLPLDRTEWNKGIDMVSGATFSSAAVVNSIIQAFDLFAVKGGNNG